SRSRGSFSEGELQMSSRTSTIAPAAESHAWTGTGTLTTRAGDFEFKNSYPAGDASRKLRDALVFNRAVEAYLVQMHGVSWYHVWKGISEAGAGVPNQMVIWETLMDAQTLLLT